jgi:hypothetical protein
MCVNPEALVGDKPIYEVIAHWACGEIVHSNENAHADQIIELFDVWPDAALGIEDFVIKKFLSHREFLSPVRITSKVEYALWDDVTQKPIRRLFKQDPSLAKRTLTDDRQRDFNLWEAGKDHKRDGIKHCYTFLQRCQESARMRYAAFPLLFRSNGDLLHARPPTGKRGHYR